MDLHHISHPHQPWKVQTECLEKSRSDDFVSPHLGLADESNDKKKSSLSYTACPLLAAEDHSSN